jgi:very-short-patch-repair endonuclease
MNKHNKTLLRFWESDINNNKQSVINTLNNTILHD